MVTNNDKRITDDRKWPSIRWLDSAERWQVDGRLGIDGKGGGRRETFLTREEAEKRRQELRKEHRRGGTEAIEISTELRVEAVTCAQRLAKKGATITQATEHYLAYLATSSRSILWPAFLAEYLQSFHEQGLTEEVLTVRKSHYDDIRQRLGHFAEYAKDKLVSDITKEEITAWLDKQTVTKPGHPRLGQKLTAVSKRKIRTLLGSAYNYAIDANYAKLNPASVKRKVRGKKRPKGGFGTGTRPSHLTMSEILWPEEYKALLCAASEEIRPALILQGFCGIRRDEIQRCIWEQIDWDAGRVHVPWDVSKTGDYRYIPIRPAISAWLAKYKEHVDPEARIAPKNYREELDRARVASHAALIEANSEHTLARWPINCLRHGFASFYLAAGLGTVQQLADEMGTSENLIRDTYRQVTTPELGKAHWSIIP